MLAGPVVAQTTVTSAGRNGPTACLDKMQVDAGNIPITALSATSVTFTNPDITWNQYVTRLGDVPAPAKAFVSFGVYNADTDSLIGRIFVTLSSGQSFSSRTINRSDLAAKTLYYLEATVQAQDADSNVISSIPTQVFARRCFMTGGTYTMTVAPNTSGQTSGCFAISEFKGTMDTIQHVRNCWCGRKTTLPLFGSTQDNTNWHNMWNCR